MIIDEKAIVNPNADIGEGVEIGPFAIVDDDVIIGKGTKIESHAVIRSGSRIGENCRIFHGAVIGSIPQDLKFKNEYSTVHIGNKTTVREYCTVNRGTEATGKTSVGSDCLLMAYAHVAHDCVLGNNVIISNSVNMAGHVLIDDFAIVGGITPIHQFVRIGKYAFIGGGLRCDRDVPPYILAADDPLTYKGLNVIGLRRRNFSQEMRSRIKNVYKAIYRKNMNLTQAFEHLKADEEKTPEILEIYNFIKNSKRGII